MPANNSSPITVNAYINGQNVESSKHIPRENPANPDEIVGYYPDNTLEEAKAAIDAAAEAFKTWSKTSVDERISMMKSASEKIKAKMDELSVLLAREHGKPLYDAKGEITISTIWMDYQSGIVKEQIKDYVFEDENGRVIVAHDPVGVVGAITPWNYPIILSLVKVVPALLCGNTMVVKPSPFAPFAIHKIIEIIAAEFPKGVLNIVHGGGEVGAELTSNPKILKVAFTGGTKTGSTIMKAAADTIKKITLELGGNDPGIVLEDFDLNDEKALRRMVIANFLTGGQICMIAKRVYVHRSIYDEFVKKYIEAANKWIRIGDPLNPEVTVGPVNNSKQVQFVQSLVDDAKNNGCEIIKLGRIVDEELFNKGYFLQPTLVLGADYNSRIVLEEQFGPAVPILPYDSEEQAIAEANKIEYGLTSSVWGEEEHAIRVARQIQAGVTMINTAALQGFDIRFPFGGVKQSGIGREFGPGSFVAYTEEHVLTVPKSGDLPYIPE
ncbi:aldehyde dehydrogenase family protein [Neobacillus sp. 114]|uniref:aldehyde dehydrogenase family protein n=1 Tax=Neobacillus sp. 114 TaxID=3048535 RepID=UPI0024C457C8|nr:aldehyde dehydrogenase family protein [Neobacillus sp. 114]